MPFGDNDWLALTKEPTLDPELPICDPHHHFWDLRPQSIPYQRYLLHELNALSSANGRRETNLPRSAFWMGKARWWPAGRPAPPTDLGSTPTVTSIWP